MAAVPICIYPSGYDLSGPELARYGPTHRYTTMVSMEAGEDGTDWVTDTDNPLVEILGGDGVNNWDGNPDTDKVTYLGWTLSETYYFTITTLGTARSSDGLWDTAAYILSTTNTTIFIDNSTSFYGHFEGLQLQNTGSAGNTFYAYDHIGIVEVKNCYIDINGGANGIRHNTLAGGLGIVRVWNTIVTNGTAEQIITNDDTTFFYHVLVNGEASGSMGYRGYNNATDCHNSISFNVSGGSDFNQCNIVNFCASDAAHGTNAIDLDDNTSGEWTNAWTDYTAHDYHVKDASSLLYNAGDDLSNQFTDLTGDTDPLKYDIIGNDRSGTWDVGPFVLAAVGTDYTRSLTESVGVADAISRAGAFKKSIAESVGISDTVTRAGIFIRSLSDSVGVTDVINKSIQFVRSLSDSIGVTDAINRTGQFVRSLSDSVGITDVINRVANFIRAIYETIGATDLISRTGNYKRSITDNVGITDTIDKLKSEPGTESASLNGGQFYGKLKSRLMS